MISWIITIPNRLKTQGMCNKAVARNPRTLAYVPDCFKTQEMYDKVVDSKPYTMRFAPDHFKS